MGFAHTVGDKGDRLQREGKVRRLESVEVWEVQDDHDTYRVIVTGGRAECFCPATSAHCSHVHAVSWQQVRERVATARDPFARLGV